MSRLIYAMPNLFSTIYQSAKRLFRYDIAKESVSRTPPATVLYSEDRELNSYDRKKAVSRSREIPRDFSLAKWALEKHADYTSQFRFQSQTGITELDHRIEQIIGDWSEEGHFEVTGKFSLDEFIRLAEICRTVDGDVGILKLDDGCVQAIEGDRIRTPNDNDFDRQWKHGVKTNAAGAPISYAVHRRTRDGTFEFERDVSARHLILHGYYSRFDQERGIGLLVTAANQFKDIYDIFGYTLSRLKLMQLFGLKFTRGDEQAPLGDDRIIAFKNKASYLVELNPGENIESIESHQPSNESQDFAKTMIMVALKSLNINYSMFDEGHTNFYGSRAGITQYVESCKPKRRKNQRLLKHLTRWKLSKEILAGRLSLPDGMTVNDLRLEWTPAGLPWWRPDEEAKGLLTTITSGFDSYSGVCRTLGKEFKDIILERKQDEEFAKQHNVLLPTMVDKVNLNIGT